MYSFAASARSTRNAACQHAVSSHSGFSIQRSMWTHFSEQNSCLGDSKQNLSGKCIFSGSPIVFWNVFCNIVASCSQTWTGTRLAIQLYLDENWIICTYTQHAISLGTLSHPNNISTRFDFESWDHLLDGLLQRKDIPFKFIHHLQQAAAKKTFNFDFCPNSKRQSSQSPAAQPNAFLPSIKAAPPLATCLKHKFVNIKRIQPEGVELCHFSSFHSIPTAPRQTEDQFYDSTVHSHGKTYNRKASSLQHSVVGNRFTCSRLSRTSAKHRWAPSPHHTTSLLFRIFWWAEASLFCNSTNFFCHSASSLLSMQGAPISGTITVSFESFC